MGSCFSRDPNRGSGDELVPIKRHATWPRTAKAVSLDEYEFATWDLRRTTSHNQRTTTFRHPVTGQVSPENSDFFLQEQAPSLRMTARPPAAGGDGLGGVGMEQHLRPSSTAISETSTSVTSSTVDTTSTSKVSRSAGRVHSFGKRDQAIKRNPNVPVVVRGWLYKQDSSGMRLWKRKWFVLADYCLFYYKDSREESVLGSIPLPSYVVSPVGPEDHISRKYAFKAEHSGMRTYYFSADTQEDMNGWLRAMNQAALMHNHTDTLIRPPEKSEPTSDAFDGQALPHTNHVNHRVKTETPDPETSQPMVHEVLLEPIHHPNAEEHLSLQKDTPTTTASSVMELPMGSPPTETDPPAASAHIHQMDPEPSAPSSVSGSRAPSRAPSRAASTLPPAVCTRNGLVSTPSPILEPNGIGAGTYLRTPPGATLPPSDLHQQHRRSTLEEVEQWVKVQRAEHKGPPSRESTLPRRTPPTQPKFSTKEAYQTLPKTSRPSPPPAARLGEYKYAQDRLSHFRLTPEQTGPGGPTTGAAVWQLYEWQQRHQFRHGSPTAPLYTPAPDYPFGTRPPSTVPPSSSTVGSRTGTEGGLHPSRCVSVPPTAADIPPPGPPSRGISPMRRPHTPADRVTVMPMGERSGMEVPFAASPRRTKSQMLKAATIERRSMPPTGYITHTVSAPSLHGKTADDTYVQLKRDLEYLDLKVFGSQTVKDSGKPVKVAESDVDVKLSQLCEQDKTLKELEANISSLKEDKDKLESVLDVSHQQMEQYQDQPAHSQKIAYQQRLLQEDLVAIRAQISRVSTEMSRAWEEYSTLESSVEKLRAALQAQMNISTTPQEKAQIKRELWRIEDVMGGLSASKANYKITISSVHNPERKLVPSVSDPAVPSQSAKLQPPLRSSQTLPHSTVPKWAEESAPPRPPLPHLYDYEDTPPVIPPLPKEASVIRHTSVRGLKRQSDERKRDRESGQCAVNGDCKVELRSYLSEPELPGLGRSNTGSEMNYQTLPSKGLSGSSSRLNQPSSFSSYVTLRRGPGGSITRERPRSALERLSSPADSPPLQGGAPLAPGVQQRGRMTAEEQLERMKRHQRALVRERKRNLSQGERSVSQRPSSSRLPVGASDPTPSVSEGGAYQLEERLGAEGQSDEGRGQMKDGQRVPSEDQWVTAIAMHLREVDVEPVEYNLDFSLELGRPRKVPIPERYVESDPEEPLSQDELDERSRKAQRIKNLLAKSSVQNIQMSSGQWVPVDFSELDSVVQQQERIMTVSHALASEASRKSKLVAAKAASER